MLTLWKEYYLSAWHHIECSTSSYTMLHVYVRPRSLIPWNPSTGTTHTWMCDGSPTRDSATYNRPCVNTGSGKNTPTQPSV